MDQRIRLITPPDIIFSSAHKVLLLNLGPDLSQSFMSAVLHSKDSFDIYQYSSAAVDVKWVLTVSSVADRVFVDVDHVGSEIEPFLSYLISMPHVYYRDTHNRTPWHLLSQNKIFGITDSHFC